MDTCGGLGLVDFAPSRQVLDVKIVFLIYFGNRN